MFIFSSRNGVEVGDLSLVGCSSSRDHPGAQSFFYLVPQPSSKGISQIIVYRPQRIAETFSGDLSGEAICKIVLRPNLPFFDAVWWIKLQMHWYESRHWQ